MKTEKEIKERLKSYRNRLRFEKESINNPEYQADWRQSAIMTNIRIFEAVICELKYIIKP
jgi:hypothetical protein